jgi:hypothetical protein
MKEYDEKELISKTFLLLKRTAFQYESSFVQANTRKPSCLKTMKNIDIQLHEQLDYARIYGNKGLYCKACKILDLGKRKMQSSTTRLVS